MKAYDAKSQQNLEQAVAVLGGSERARLVVQTIYDLGMVDGQLKQIDGQIASSADNQVPA